MKRIMTYILLRDNKETGPLSLDEVLARGLKSTDLVWVEGQSVCWLNPDQIAELRDFVGASPTPVAKTEAIVEKKAVEVEEAIAFPQEKQEAKPITSNGISAYMPVPDEETFVKPVQPTPKASKPIEAETKFSQPLDELKELYAKTLEKRLKKKSFSLQLPPQVKKAGLYLGLLAAGIIAGVLINKGGKKEKNAPELSAASIDNKQNTGLTEPAAIAGDSNVISEPLVNTVPADERYYPEESRYEEARSQPVERKERIAEPPVSKQAPPAVNEERIEKTESKPKETPDRSILNEIRSQVSVKSNNYDVGSFGGIRNLKLTVSNDSKYTLDQVVVELLYLKPRDEFLKSENISFHSIGPNDSKTVSIPKSTRGVKVSYKILRIESKEMSNTTAGL
jgi:hypothetical protein